MRRTIGGIIKHENGCCKNPSRICNYCKMAGTEQMPMNDLIEALKYGGLQQLRKEATNCPMCILSALVQAGRGGTEGKPEDLEFDFKREREQFMRDINDADAGGGRCRPFQPNIMAHFELGRRVKAERKEWMKSRGIK